MDPQRFGRLNCNNWGAEILQVNPYPEDKHLHRNFGSIEACWIWGEHLGTPYTFRIEIFIPGCISHYHGNYQLLWGLTSCPSLKYFDCRTQFMFPLALFGGFNIISVFEILSCQEEYPILTQTLFGGVCHHVLCYHLSLCRGSPFIFPVDKPIWGA